MRNTSIQASYHWSQKTLHWLTLIFVIGLVTSGFIVMELDYYHPWYKTGPDLHKSFGAVLLLITFLRLGLYRFGLPKPLESHSRLERVAARITKVVLIALIVGMCLSGYLMVTAVGDPLYVFDVLSVPAIVTAPGMEETWGEIHEVTAWCFIAVIVLHAVAGMKHHFIDKDNTLRRILFGMKP